VLSLTVGPKGNRHLYASSGELNGKGALWATNPIAADPLSDWRKIPIPDATRGVTRVLALPRNGQIVIAAQRGIWRSPIPLDLNPLGYQWVEVVPRLGGDVWAEIAVGPNESVVAAIPGQGLFFGSWAPGALQMQRANTPGVNPADFGRTSIASCAANRQVLYAVIERNQQLFAVLSSGDGGRNWRILATQIIGQPPGTTVPAQAGDQGSYNNCIAVSPVNPAVVAIGWRVGLFISQDSGANWQNYDVVNQPPFHADLHAVYFTPPDGRRLFIGSDGGVVAADVMLGPPDQPWLRNLASGFNRGLATLQFSDQFSDGTGHGIWATFSVNDQLAAGGVQDNGNVYTRWRNASPWRRVGDSDGQLTLFLRDTGLLFDNTSDHTHPTLATWNGVQMSEKGVVPLWKDDGGVDPGGVFGLGSPKELFVEPVCRPLLPSRHDPRFRILAVAGVGNKLFGLFNDDQAGVFHHWETLGNIGLNPDDFITAAASFDGRAVFIGSHAGRLFRLNPANGTVAETSPGGIGKVTRIIVDGSVRPALRGFARADNTILQLVGASSDGDVGNWVVLGPVHGAGDTVFDIAVDWNVRTPRLFAATDTRVFSSPDGHNWNEDSQGLSGVPHCTGLQVSAGNIFLSTWGRSMWRASLDWSWRGGRTALAFVRPGSDWNSVPTLFSNGDGSWRDTNFVVPSWANQPGVIPIPGNYSGDGRTGIAFIRPGSDWNSVPVLFSNGDGSWRDTNFVVPSWANQPG
jgi:hypothetical protein